MGASWKWKASTNIAQLLLLHLLTHSICTQKTLFALKMGQISFERTKQTFALKMLTRSICTQKTQNGTNMVWAHKADIQWMCVEFFKRLSSLTIYKHLVLAGQLLVVDPDFTLTNLTFQMFKWASDDSGSVIKSLRKGTHFLFQSDSHFSSNLQLLPPQFHLFPNFPDTFTEQWVYFAELNSQYFMKLSQTEQSCGK